MTHTHTHTHTYTHTHTHTIKCILRIKATSPGVVVIEGAETGLYLSMNEDGKLYASSCVTDESYFLERMEENHYNTYQSQKHGENWYVGIKKNGKMKRGPRTHIGQKAIFFLPRQVDQTKD
uniref:Fibroblast growth factor n=1 Tax=Cyprinus carpio TaxID=7962 RepID=A0A8C2I0I2_CYPCA